MTIGPLGESEDFFELQDVNLRKIEEELSYNSIQARSVKLVTVKPEYVVLSYSSFYVPKLSKSFGSFLGLYADKIYSLKIFTEPFNFLEELKNDC